MNIFYPRYMVLCISNMCSSSVTLYMYASIKCVCVWMSWIKRNEQTIGFYEIVVEQTAACMLYDEVFHFFFNIFSRSRCTYESDFIRVWHRRSSFSVQCNQMFVCCAQCRENVFEFASRTKSWIKIQ